MKTFKGYGFFVLMLLVLALVFIANEYFINSNRDNYSVTQFKQDIMEEKIQSVEVRQNAEVPTGELTAKYSNGEKRVYVSDVNQILQFLDEKNFTQVRVGDVARTPWYLEVLPYIIGVVLILLLFSMMSSNANGGGGGGKMMNFGKSRAKLTMPDDKVKTFQDVAGLVEEKEQLEEEMFVGVGASRVRDLFAEAKKNAPCIVFIDEIDAVARRRGSGLGGGHDEREQTLNQMLVEMDGFGINEGIIVMAATNRVDILDPAILRPGRFDRKITVGRPDVRGREEILKVHAKDKPLSDDVNLEDIARTTAGFVGADLENLLNEAAIAAARDNRVFIVEEDIKKSFIKVGIGAEKRSKVISDKDKRITAYHEAGHAILFHLLPDVGPVYTVSIIPTGQGAAGYTMPLPEKDELHLTKGKMLQDITVCLGGRIAESIAFDDVTTGAVQDIKQATEAARDMVTRYGFSDELGMINYDTSDDEVFIGRDIAHTKTFSEGTAEIIDREVKKIINSCHEKATSILKANQDILDRLAKLLIEKERITREEFELLFEQNDDETVENA